MAVFALLLWKLGTVLTPFLIAAVLAYVLNPLVGKLQKRSPRLSRSAASTIVIVLFLLLVLSLLALVAPIVLQDLPKIRALIPWVLDSLSHQLGPVLNKLGLPIKLEAETLKHLLANWMGDGSDENSSILLSHFVWYVCSGWIVFLAFF